MSSASALKLWRLKSSLLLITILILTPITSMVNHPANQYIDEENKVMKTGDPTPWDSLEQPWGQYGRTPTHNGTMPIHGPNGGPGQGDVENVTEFGIIDNPVINWVAIDDSDNSADDGSDLYGSIIADFSTSITSTPAAVERCGQGELFAVIVYSESGISKMAIVTGDDAKVAWEVALGETLPIRTTPMLVDSNQDGKNEILIAYDTESSLEIELWSPDISCSESGWQKNGHGNEKMWTFSSSDYKMSKSTEHNWDFDPSPQPLLADLMLDGTPELVLALNDETSNEPTVVSLSLTSSAPTSFDWEVSLSDGTHVSDPAWAALDDDSTAIVITTFDDYSGNMWVWRIDGASGSLDWERVAIPGDDPGASDHPMTRLPGPVIVQLDSDSAPEMILTVPTDTNDENSGNGARFVAMEMTSTTEIFNFRTPNGWANTHPLPIDTDDDNIHDRLCWVTFTSEGSFLNRIGYAGCHDITADPPIKEWSKSMDNDNGKNSDADEIAVAPPLWMDINGDAYPELLVPYANRLWAFDGDDGTSAGVSPEWTTPVDLSHRTFAAPAVADMDGDGTLDILIGDTLISQLAPDLTPLSDNRGISFNPSQPDPGNTVTVTGQFSNVGTIINDEDVDVILKQNGNEIGRQRFTEVKPVAPTGDGGPYTFSVDIIAELGIHSFEMILDINGNLTEAREDNNYQEVQLVVVEPYVAQVDTPNEVTRITPGGSDTVSISMLSTGSRTEPWTLTWDDSNLPDGWSVSEAPNQDTTATLVPGIAQNFDFYVSIPGTALGDDNSYIELFLTLDIDTNIVFSSILPIEVLRTRGLTIVGPSGLDNTDGFGRPGQVATGWMMVENLGNAYESTTSIDWTAPSWGGTPTLHDSTGNEVFSLNLAPNQQMELFVHLNTPPSTPLGSITTTTMTMCIGSGSETLCEDLYVNLTATAVTIEDTHHRTLPNQTLSWSVEGLIPDDGEISWNMASANMIHTGWIWTVDGDLVLNGSNIEASGTSDQFFSGNIYVDLPINAVPQRHYFNTESLNDPNHEMYFTMQVLQVYRSSATILQPIPSNPGEDISMFVEVTNQVLLRLENPGNGQDEFILETEVVEGVGMTSPPMVEFTTYNPQRTLGALATTIATVDVVVSEDTPAQESFILRFTWTSLGDSNVSTTVDLSVQAEPDHSWEVVFDSGLNHAITPKETVTLNYEVKNTGNAIDHVVLKPTFELAYFGQDSSSWNAEEMVYENITVNETVNMSLSFTAPSDSWSGTVANLVLDIYSEELLVGNVTLTFTVQQISGWRFNLSNTNLVIDPNGQNLTLSVEHLGNLEQQPWYSKAGDGWNISVPQNGELVQPYGDSTVTIFVSPPEDAIAGEVGVLRLRISDGDGSGQTIQEVPVRVGTSPDIDLYSKGNWAVNQNGGMPTAWVVNSGNDISILEITVSGLPGGWVAEYPESLIASPGQIIGIPVSLTPDSSWDGTTISVSLGINHPILGTQVLNLFVEQSNFTFLSTPVISGVSGDKSDIMISFDPNSSTMEFPNDITSTGNTFSVTLGNVEQNLTLTDTDSGIEYFVHSAGYQLPLVSASCNLDSNSMEELGRVSLTGQIATCTLNSSPDERFTGSIILFTSMGEYVNLDENQFSILSGQTESFSINVTNWKPQAGGEIKLTLMIVDSYGREIEVEQEDVISRSDGWNIGISEFSADGDIRIAITRTSYQRLVGVTCRINIDSPDSAWSETLIIDIGGIDYAPIIEIDNPGVLDDDDLVNVELRCDQPYDIDDNSEDDTAQAYYKSSKAETIEGSDVLIGILTSGLILVVAYFAGLLSNKPRVSRTRKDEVSIPVQENVEEQEIVVESDDEQDEFNLQIEEEEEEVPIDLDDEPVIEELRVDDSSASGRLASLRGEILIDEEPKDTRPISDRMDDFFKN